MSDGGRSFKVLADYLEACKTLDPLAFSEACGDAFLLHHGSFDQLVTPVDGDSTQDLEQPGGQEGPVLEPSADFLVLPLRALGRVGRESEMIWIGRSETNEVVIPDSSISEVHAFIRREADGFQIQDTGSRNGTWIDNVKVLPQGAGDPTPLESGSRLRLGAVGLTFLLAQPFRTLVLGLLG